MRTWIQIGVCGAIAGILMGAAPTAEEVLAKARKALGGEAKLAGLKSLTATGAYRRIPGPGTRVVTAGGGNAAPAVVTGEAEVSFLLPDCFLKSETMGTGISVTVLEGLSSGKAWTDTRNSMGPSGGFVMIRRDVGPNPETALERRVRETFARYLLAWTLSAPGVQFTYAGEAEAPDGKADVLDAKGPDDFAARLFLDKESHLPLMMTYRGKVAVGGGVRMQVPAGGPPPDLEKLKKEIESMPPPPTRDVEIQMRFADYDKAGGIQLPKVITWSVDGAITEELEVKKYAVNPNLAPDKFRKEK